MTPDYLVSYYNLMDKITKRQKQLLQIIYDYIKDTGYPPTFEEMRGSLGVASNQSIIDLLKKLEDQKLLKKIVAWRARAAAWPARQDRS